MSYYLRYESDGTTYNDDGLSSELLELVTERLDEFLPSPSVSYNRISLTDEVITITGGYELVNSFVPLDEEELGGETVDYLITIPTQ